MFAKFLSNSALGEVTSLSSTWAILHKGNYVFDKFRNSALRVFLPEVLLPQLCLGESLCKVPLPQFRCRSKVKCLHKVSLPQFCCR